MTVSGRYDASGSRSFDIRRKRKRRSGRSPTNPIVISTIARVTFYGHDQTGREVSATGNIDVTFANFGDPK